MKRFKIFITMAAALLAITLLAGCGAEKTSTGDSGSAGQKAASDSVQDQQDNGGFREYPIGDEKEVEGMKIGAVYFQPAPMEPAAKAGLKPDRADIHLEADIAALADNKVGFGAGEFIPYLTVNYILKNLDNGQEQKGTFMPMNAGDGAHYGANVKLMGAGNYELTYIIDSPEKKDYLLHVDKETGVEGRFWNKPIEVKWTFPWVPRKW